MKKRILAYALIMIVSISAAFAGTGGEVNEKVSNSFKKEFAGAKDVQFDQGKEFTKATFTLNDQVMFAYFSEEGQLLAVTRNIVSVQLPINLFSDVKKNYNNYWISELFEIAMNNETAYYITLENGDQKIILKSNGANGWELFKKERKEAV